MPTDEPDGPFDVFISYSSVDVAHAVELERALEGAGLDVWRDKKRLQTGDHVVPTISAALRNSAAVAVLWSDNACQSRWVQKEADYAEVAGKFLPLAIDGFDYGALDAVFRDYNCGKLSVVLTDPAEFKKLVLARRVTPSAAAQIRHPDIRPVPGFTGRAEMLAALDAKLGKGGHAVAIRNATDAAIAVRGMGGVGKTVLARTYAWDNRARYHGLWWVRAEARDTLIDDLAALGQRLGLVFGDAEPEDAALATLDHVAQSRTHAPWLLIYDNVEDKALIRRFTPPENAHCLITTRLPGWFGEAEELPVDVFPRDTAIAFLLAYAPGETPETAGRLADALGRLPLALAHARALCRTRAMSFDAYAAQFAALIDRMPKDADTDYPNTVFATFSLAMDRAKADCPAAETLMGLIAHFAPDQIPLWLIRETVMPEAGRDDALEALARVSLIARDALADGAPAISVHRLVQEVARARLRKAGEAEGYAAQAVNTLYDSFDFYNDTFAIQHRRTAWLPHALTMLDHAPREGDDAGKTVWVCNFIGDFRVNRGELFRAKNAYETGLKIASGLADASPGNAGWQRDLSVSHDRIGDVLSAQGNLAEALKAYQASLEIRDKLAKADPGNAGWQRDLSVSHNKIADVLSAQGNLAEALKAYQASLAIADKLAKADPGNAGWQRDLSVSHDRIGDVLSAQGNLAEALKAYQASLEIRDKLAKADPGNAGWQRDLSVSHNKIADVLSAQGNLAEALKAYQASLEIRDKLAKADPGNAGWQADLAASHGKLGQLQEQMGNIDEARRLWLAGRAIVAPFAEASGHQLWIGYLRSFDNLLADLDAKP